MPDRNFVLTERDYLALKNDLFHARRELSNVKNALTYYGMRRHQDTYMPAKPRWGQYINETGGTYASGAAVIWGTFRQDGSGDFVQDSTGDATYIELPGPGWYLSTFCLEGFRNTASSPTAYNDDRLTAGILEVAGTTISDASDGPSDHVFNTQEITVTWVNLFQVISGTPPKIELHVYSAGGNSLEIRGGRWLIEYVQKLAT